MIGQISAQTSSEAASVMEFGLNEVGAYTVVIIIIIIIIIINDNVYGAVIVTMVTA